MLWNNSEVMWPRGRASASGRAVLKHLKGEALAQVRGVGALRYISDFSENSPASGNGIKVEETSSPPGDGERYSARPKPRPPGRGTPTER